DADDTAAVADGQREPDLIRTGAERGDEQRQDVLVEAKRRPEQQRAQRQQCVVSAKPERPKGRTPGRGSDRALVGVRQPQYPSFGFMRCRQAEFRCMLGGMIDEPSLPMIAGRPDGCVYGWRLYLATTVAAVWIPLAATLIPANRADDEEAPAPICRLPAEVGFVPGDVRYADPDLHALRAAQDRILVTTKHGPDPHTDPGVEVRRLF